VVGVDAGDAEADLVHVGFADEERAGGAEAGDDGGIASGGLMAEEGSAGGGGEVQLVEFVLDGDGDAVEGAERAALTVAQSRGSGLGAEVFGVEGDKGTEPRLGGFARGVGAKEAFGDLVGSHQAVTVCGGERGGGFEGLARRWEREVELGRCWLLGKVRRSGERRRHDRGGVGEDIAKGGNTGGTNHQTAQRRAQDGKFGAGREEAKPPAG
jgi:hypothetical protein